MGRGRISLANSSGNSRISDHCAASAISQSTVLARLVIDGLCLAATVFLLWFWLKARRKTLGVKQLLPWYTFGVVLGLTALYVCVVPHNDKRANEYRYSILGILISVLSPCNVIGPWGAAELSVPASVASGLADILLLAIVLIPLTKRLLLHGGSETNLVKAVNMSTLGLTAITFCPAIVLSNMASLDRFSSDLDSPAQSLLASLSVSFSLTFYIVYLLSASIGSAIILTALFRAKFLPKVC